MENQFEQLYRLILKSKYILLVTHRKPDGDALGSMTALIQYFEKIKQRYFAFCLDPLPWSWQSLPYLSKIASSQKGLDVLKEQMNLFDLKIILDSDWNYTGLSHFTPRFSSTSYLVIIDHHPTTRPTSNLDLVCPQASSTAEILTGFFKKNEIEITKSMATSLLAGIIYDTHHFSNPMTTFSALKTAALLLKKGARFNKKVNHYVKSMTILKCWGEILVKLTQNKEKEITSIVITQDDFKNGRENEGSFEGLSNFLNNLTDSKMVLVLKEEKGGLIKGSLRTSYPLIDVSQLAIMLGGGGHQRAAGFSLKGHLEKTTGGWRVV